MCLIPWGNTCFCLATRHPCMREQSDSCVCPVSALEMSCQWKQAAPSLRGKARCWLHFQLPRFPEASSPFCSSERSVRVCVCVTCVRSAVAVSVPTHTGGQIRGWIAMALQLLCVVSLSSHSLCLARLLGGGQAAVLASCFRKAKRVIFLRQHL